MLEGKLYNLSLLDEEELTSASTIEELASYQGLVHVRDLAMMLGDLLHYYRPFGHPLSMHARNYIIQQYDKWVAKNCVETIAFAADLNNDFVDDEVRSTAGSLVERNKKPKNEGKQVVKSGFYTPCKFSYRSVHTYSSTLPINMPRPQPLSPVQEAGNDKHFREQSVMFTDICIVCMWEDGMDLSTGQYGDALVQDPRFVDATPGELAAAKSTLVPKLVADASVQFDKFAAWFMKLNDKLLPRVEAELLVEESRTNNNNNSNLNNNNINNNNNNSPIRQVGYATAETKEGDADKKGKKSKDKKKEKKVKEKKGTEQQELKQQN